jgi:DNA mismatch repair protein MutS2
MEAETRVVIVTGPNTGGKTVALKTVGLFALMNQFGLALPLAEGSSLPVFDGVFADIGDEQSISQSLSTFSAHMTNMAYITSLASERSLVLLDELGSGTDPEEGSAIAMSLLDHFIACRSRVIVTTHHGILKNFGYTKPGVVNASVDFDAKTLSPTYRIVLGIPGESHAIEIAARNGLPADIVARSRTYLDEERADVSELIKGLKSKHQELDQAEAARNKEEQRLRDDRRKSDLRELRLRQKELELREQGVGSLRRLLLESRKNLENLVRELREGELTREKTLKVKEFIADLERSTASENERLELEEANLAELNEKEREELTRLALQTPEPKSTSRSKKANSRGDSAGGHENGAGKGRAGDYPAGKGAGGSEEIKSRVPSKVEPGIEVLVGTSRRRGLVLRSAKKGSWVVELGALKMTFPERELSPVAPSATPKAEITIMDLAPGAPAAFELNLRGMRLEEALDALRRQVDAAAMSGLYEFSIIHGKGDGILQKGVHEYLKSQKVVADYYFARPEDGGYGKTMVSLKR